MTALICGSMAYDTVMVFHGRFKDHILADRVHMLNVSFWAPEMRRNYGGCAGNIAYNMKLLGLDGLPLAAVGEDFDAYAAWMQQVGIDQQYIRRLAGVFTAQAYITTDLDANQITAFHPGAMERSHEVAVPTDAGITVGIVSPDGREAMIRHAQQFYDAGIPFMFDPGQGLPLFGGQDLEMFIDQAAWVVVNDYEGQLVQERTGLKPEQIAERCRAYIVTRGAEGSCIYASGQRIDIPVAKAERLADPTGCGDAYRAGLLYGIMKDLDWSATGRIASLIGSIKMAAAGTQNHRFTLTEFAARYRAAFGSAFA